MNGVKADPTGLVFLRGIINLRGAPRDNASVHDHVTNGGSTVGPNQGIVIVAMLTNSELCDYHTPCWACQR
jgi:hypothetical protein